MIGHIKGKAAEHRSREDTPGLQSYLASHNQGWFHTKPSNENLFRKLYNEITGSYRCNKTFKNVRDKVLRINHELFEE